MIPSEGELFLKMSKIQFSDKTTKTVYARGGFAVADKEGKEVCKADGKLNIIKNQEDVVGSGHSISPKLPIKLDIGCNDTCARAACAQSLVLQVQSRSHKNIVLNVQSVYDILTEKTDHANVMRVTEFNDLLKEPFLIQATDKNHYRVHFKIEMITQEDAHRTVHPFVILVNYEIGSGMRHLNVLWKIDDKKKMYTLLNNWGDDLQYHHVSFNDDLVFYRQHTGLYDVNKNEILLSEESKNIDSYVGGANK